MKLPQLAIKNYHFTLVVFSIVCLYGIASYLTMPKSEDPYTEYNTTSILVVNPGSTPEDMETLIVDPIEKSVNELEGIRNITTHIQDGVAVSYVEYNIGEDPEKKHQEIVQKVNEVRGELPATIFRLDVEQPSVLNVSVYQLAFVSGGASARALKQSAESLKKKLEKIPGVRRVALHGEPETEVQIQLDLERLAANHIPLDRVITILQSENLSIPGGQVELGNKLFTIQTSGLYKNLDEIRNTVIDAGANGIILLRDLARVEFDYKKAEVQARYNGREALWLTVEQKKGINLYALSDEVDRTVSEFSGQLPADRTLEVVLRQADGVKERINGFFLNFIQGIVLVGAIILLSLGFRSSLVVLIAIPVSVLAGIGLIDLSGFGLQQMSIAGLIIALGMLVDNSIAIAENIYRYMAKGYKPMEAAVQGSSEIAMALVSSTVTTLLAFGPMLLMSNDVGRFIRSMILIVMYTLAASLVVALCLSPFVAGKVIKQDTKAKKQSGIDRFVSRYYSPWLERALARPVVVVVASVLIFLGSVSLMPLIGVSFFPKAEKNQLMVNINGVEGTNLKNTSEAVLFVEELARQIPEVQKVAATSGEGNPQVYYNMLQLNPAANQGQVYLVLDRVRPNRMNEIVALLRKETANYPNAKIEIREFVQGPPVDAPVQIRLFSDDLDALKEAAARVEEVYGEVPGLININNPFSVAKTDMLVCIDRFKAGQLGVSLLTIDRAVRAAVNGLQVSSYQDRLGEKYNMVVKASDDNTRDVDWMEKIYLPTATGAQVKLSQVASLELTRGIKSIDHYDLDRYVSVLADVDESVQSIDKATREVVAKVEALGFDDRITYSVGGEQESRDESFGGLGKSYLVALLGILAVLVLQFNSFRQPLIIFTAIPLSVTGSFLGLLLSGNSFSFMAFVGLTSLMGIVINSSIILVDYANQLRGRGLSVREAVLEAAQTRFTPILLTTVTTVAGLLPLTLFGGSMWAPMGWAIIGGLLFSTLLTLILVPVLYLGMSKDISQNVPA